uniref:Uncharacterized protein n=1 Tax=Ascaris lumbricoides TaxID=6252 RepID=A0A0M3HVJ4_ASCLU
MDVHILFRKKTSACSRVDRNTLRNRCQKFFAHIKRFHVNSLLHRNHCLFNCKEHFPEIIAIHSPQTQLILFDDIICEREHLRE